MLLKPSERSPRWLTVRGQLFFVVGQLMVTAGILLSRFARQSAGTEDAAAFSALDFIQGLSMGCGAVLLGISLPLNLAALRARRRDGHRQ